MLKTHTQVVVVYLQPFCRNSVLKCALHLKIEINLLKAPFFWGGGFKVVQNHLCW